MTMTENTVHLTISPSTRRKGAGKRSLSSDLDHYVVKELCFRQLETCGISNHLGIGGIELMMRIRNVNLYATRDIRITQIVPGVLTDSRV
jgi:hypothetical protein